MVAGGGGWWRSGAGVLVGQCKQIAPHYDALAAAHPDVLFLKCDVDVLSDSAAQAGVAAMPTFHFLRGGAKVAEVVGTSRPPTCPPHPLLRPRPAHLVHRQAATSRP